MRVAVIQGTIAHAHSIVSDMRVPSVAEVERVGLDPKRTVEDAVNRAALCWAGTINGKLVCLGGVEQTTLLSDSAYLWLITTKAVEAHPFVFVRRSQMVLEAIMEQYRMVYGVVDQNFTRSILWLRWLDFKIEPADETDFRRFSKRRK